MIIKLKKNQAVPKLGTLFVRELPLSKIFTGFGASHRRLRVFHHKGLACVNPCCSNVGTRLIESIDAQGGLHVDLFTDDLMLMNIDHIIARARGGTNDLENLQPMCRLCNTAKGHADVTLDELQPLVEAQILKEARSKEKREKAKKEYFAKMQAYRDQKKADAAKLTEQEAA